MVQPCVYDRLAERFESAHVEGDVVIDQEDGSGAVFRSIAYVRQHPIERIGVKLPAPHRDNRAETTVEGATPGSLDDVNLTTQHRIVIENSRAAVG